MTKVTKMVIKIKLLSAGETIAVMKLPKFNILKPVVCEDCGQKTDFTRKIFSIGGVKQDRYCDDEVQDFICSYIGDTYGIAYVFFKSPMKNSTLILQSAQSASPLRLFLILN